MSPSVLAPPTGLAVIYDDRCELCRRCRAWLESQEALVPLEFRAASDPALAEWSRDWLPVGDELVVVGDDGSIWVGPDAFITCLWALRKHRALAGRLQRPGLRGVAKQAFHALSLGRGTVSSVLTTGQAVERAAEPAVDGSCPGGVCTT